MKHTILMVLLCITALGLKAQDKIYLHNGDIATGTVLKVSEFTITYKYESELAERVISKYAVNKIVYNNGRTENITDKINVLTKDDWEKVMIFEDKSCVAGLIKVADISGRTRWFSQHSANGADRKATMKLKQAAAEMGCSFVLMVSEVDPHYTGSTNYNAIRKGIGYKYK